MNASDSLSEVNFKITCKYSRSTANFLLFVPFITPIITDENNLFVERSFTQQPCDLMFNCIKHDHVYHHIFLVYRVSIICLSYYSILPWTEPVPNIL